MSTDLERALELADLRAIVADLYPDSGARPGPGKQRVKAVWRGGDNPEVVSLSAKTAHDFKTGETYNAWTFLTDVAGYSRGEAATYLLGHVGLVDTPSAHRAAARRAAVEKRVDEQRERSKAVRLAEALTVQRSAPTVGSSGYLARKGVAAHAQRVAPIRLPGGDLLPGLIYSRDQRGSFVQVLLRDAAGTVTGVQRLYDAGVFPGGRDKDFVGTTKGAFAVVGARSLDDALDAGHVRLAEGLATALTVYAATGGAVVAVLTAGNLAPVAKALRALRPSSGLRLTIAADNDAHGDPKNGNAGLEKAHRAALLYGGTVAAPTFRDPAGRPTDFNDLMQREGLEAVQQALGCPANPDPALAFALDRRQRDRRLKGATRGRYLENLELKDGVTLLRAPHGVGKTEALKPHVARELAAGGRVLYVTPSASLTEEAARRLGLESYADRLHREHLHLIPGAAICLNSLPRLLDESGELRAPDLLVLDEAEQLVRTLTGAHVAQRERVLEALLQLIRRARRVVCLDADLGKLTRTLLTQACPGERYRWREHFHPVGEGRTLRVHAARDDLYAALSACTDPALVLTNSRAEAEALGAHLQSQGRRVRVLTGEHNEGDAAFMADLEHSAEAEGLEALVCSPTLRTGVSLTGGYFRRVFGVFWAAVGTPEDALQALWRVRTPARYDLWLDPRTAREQIDLTARYGATREHEAAALGRRVGQESSIYRTIKRAVEFSEALARGAYRLNFLRLAALQGFAFELLGREPGHKGLAAAARAQADAERYGAVAAQHARVFGWGEDAATKADELTAKRFLGRDDRAALECYRVVNFYRLTPDDDLMSVLELDHRERYRRQLTRLELTLAPVDAVQSAVDELLKERTLADDIPALASRQKFYRRVLEAVGFGPAAQMVLKGDVVQLDLPRYDTEALEPLRVWVEANRSWLAGLVALPAADKLRANLIRYVGGWLKALGLKQMRTGKNERGVYSLALGALEVACGTMQKRGTLSLEEVLKEKSVPAPSTSPVGVKAWLERLLEAGTLDGFGKPKLQRIREKLAENDQVWLHRLATSQAVRRLVGTT